MKGYEDAKRYMSIDHTNIKPAAYWELIYECKINNILLLENIDGAVNTNAELLIFGLFFNLICSDFNCRPTSTL